MSEHKKRWGDRADAYWIRDLGDGLAERYREGWEEHKEEFEERREERRGERRSIRSELKQKGEALWQKLDRYL